MELVKLENLRDQIQDRIRHLGKFNDEVSDNPMFHTQDYIRGLLHARIYEVGFLDKQLESILAEIEEHSDTKVAKSLGLERVDCDCEECKGLSLKAKKIADTLFSAMKIKSRFDFEGKFDGDLQELQELCFKLEDDISEIEKKDDSVSDMKQKLDETLSKVKDILIEFHVPGSKYWSEVHEIVEDCYRLQDYIREEVREDIREKKQNQKYKVLSFFRQHPFYPFTPILNDGVFDSLESAKEHANIMINREDVFKVDIREAGSNKLVNPRDGETHPII